MSCFQPINSIREFEIYHMIGLYMRDLRVILFVGCQINFEITNSASLGILFLYTNVFVWERLAFFFRGEEFNF